MTVEQNKALVRRYYEEIANEADTNFATTVADQILTPNFGFYALNDGEGSHGLDKHKQFLVWHQGVSPDQHWTVEELVAEGTTVASRFTIRGTHQGEFMGLAQTGKPFTVRGMDLFHIADGKIAELRWVFDLRDMLTQLSISVSEEAGAR